jgi:hypothetical protein
MRVDSNNGSLLNVAWCENSCLSLMGKCSIYVGAHTADYQKYKICLVLT